MARLLKTFHYFMIIQNEPVANLILDQNNYRTPPQLDQEAAAQALINVGPDRFWGLFQSLLQDGYTPTENLVVLETTSGNLVKEGNRRLACLKLLHRLISLADLPKKELAEINAVSDEWKLRNEKVPCTIYSPDEANVVQRIVSQIHARDEIAGRKDWPAIAKLRYDRDALGKQQPALDLLERWFKQGRNIQREEAEKWGGEYHITILEEALPKLVKCLGYNSPEEIVASYPDANGEPIERFLRDIGAKAVGFSDIRGDEFWSTRFSTPRERRDSADFRGAVSESPPSVAASSSNAESETTFSDPTGTTTESPAKSAPAPTRRPRQALPANDPRTVSRKLRALYIRDRGREKVATLRDEIKSLKPEKHPLAFCFLLRSLFETSAKAYCEEHKEDGLTMRKPDGADKKMVTVFQEVTKHLETKLADKARIAALHGARRELSNPNGILSVVSMNQLIHNPDFSTSGTDIATVFNNIYPLLVEMNA